MTKQLRHHFFQGREKVTQFLIDNGADVDIRSLGGKTLLEIAAVNGNQS